MTQTSKHTPGPWRIADSGNHKAVLATRDRPGAHGHDTLCQVLDLFRPWDPSGRVETEANAHLIAAAPDLLAACEAWTKAAHAGIDADPELWSTAENLSASAIAKARGEQGGK